MKRVLCTLLLIILGAVPGVADDTVTVSRILPSSLKTTDSTSTAPATSVVSSRTAVSATPTTTSATSVASSRTAATRGTVSTRSDSATVSRAAVAPVATSTAAKVATTTTSVAAPSVTPSRVVTSSQTTRGASTTSSSTGRTSSRALGNTNTTQTARDKLNAAVNTVGRNARVEAASINNTAAARRAGVVLRPTTAEVGGRATIAGTDVQTGSNIKSEVRTVQSRAAATTAATVPTAESIAEAKNILEQTADLNKSCQEQYNDCMDQFCAVIDANQKRCSCSSNLASYAKIETTVKEANTQLNDVAQRIRYVGLSADEIRAIMSATEAEEALTGTRDTTESRSMLQEIEDMIANPATVTSSSGGSSTLDLDLDFSTSGDLGDMFNLDFLNNNSSGLSRKRGTDLYNAAKTQCLPILNRCKSAGATADQITSNYELAIDRDCISYEQGLTKMNETLSTNVRSANLMLQKARLAVLNNKNQYGAKECVAALDTCMKDDMVCGDKYTKCLDPTKIYIDENGNVVLGQNISNIRDFMDGYNNAEINKDFIQTAMGVSMGVESCHTNNNGSCNVHYLMTKIGTGATVNDGGLCRAVLDKCQRYTYNDSGAYNPYNDIVVNYIQRAMVNVRAAQEQIISDYASTCISDLSKCYSNQVSQVNSWSTSATSASIYKVMRGACRNVALTCAYAVFDGMESMLECTGGACVDDDYINHISEVFYQTMLCPDHSTFAMDVLTDQSVAANYTTTTAAARAYVNRRCYCDLGYYVSNGECFTCPDGQTINQSTGKCE